MLPFQLLLSHAVAFELHNLEDIQTTLGLLFSRWADLRDARDHSVLAVPLPSIVYSHCPQCQVAKWLMKKTEFSATGDSEGPTVTWRVDPDVHFPTRLPDSPAFAHSVRKALFVSSWSPGAGPELLLGGQEEPA